MRAAYRAVCCTPLHIHAHAFAIATCTAKPYKNCDAWPSAVATVFYLRTRSSSFPTKSARRRMSVEGRARMHHTATATSRGCIHRARARLSSVLSGTDAHGRDDNVARIRATNALGCVTPSRLRTVAKPIAHAVLGHVHAVSRMFHGTIINYSKTWL